MKLLLLGALAALLAALGMPIAFALFGAGAWYFLQDGALPFSVYLQRVTSGLDSFPLLAVPLFIFAGNLITMTGVADRIFRFALAIFGRFPGALAHVNVTANMVLAGMSGVAQADAAALGAVAVPAMRKEGYSLPFSAALTAAAAIIGPLIPPSVIMVVYAVTAQVSIGKLFLAGVVPGVAAGLGMMLTIAVLAWRDPDQFPRSVRMNWAERAQAFYAAAPALVTPLLLVLGLTFGFATPTELGALAIIYSAVYGVIIRELDWAKFRLAMEHTVVTCGVVLLIVGAAVPIGWILAVNNLPTLISSVVLSISKEPWVVLLIINLVLLVLGCFVETTAILLIAMPALLPLSATIGVDPIHFGLIVVFNLLLGGLTPPFGALLFVIMHVTGVRMGALVRALVPFYVLLVIMLGLITYWPDPWMWLPRLY